MYPLDGPRAKVDRAKNQIIAFNASTQRFFKRYPYSVYVAEFDKKAGCYSIRIQDCPPPFPTDWNVIIGEIAHNLRSALDLLAWQLALLNSPNPYKNTAFPIYSFGYTSRPSTARFWHKNDGLRVLKSIHRRYWTRIEGFQPYKRGNGGRHNPLYLLHELNRTDKHRLIPILVVESQGYTFSGLIGGRNPFKLGKALYANAKVWCVKPLPDDGVPVPDFSSGKPKIRMQKDVQVTLDITPGIIFGHGCNAVKHLPVIPTLKEISDEVSHIIESFAADF